jgi:hypothetical protein
METLNNILLFAASGCPVDYNTKYSFDGTDFLASQPQATYQVPKKYFILFLLVGQPIKVLASQ